MKKKRIDDYANNKIYRIAVLPHSNANQIKLKQIYDTAYKSRDKSPKASSSLRKDGLNRYQLPQSDNKPDISANISMNKTNRYKAYLESQVIPKMKHNRRYSKRIEKDQQESPYLIGAITSRAERNDSVDLFKIKKKKILSSHKVSASSYTRLEEGSNDFQNAKSLYKQGKFEEAFQILSTCLQKQPKNHQFQYYCAIVSLNLQKYAYGLELLQKVCHNHPEYKKTSFLFAAISAKNLMQYQKAHELCTLGLEKYPRYNDLILYRANISMLRKNYLLANQDYQKIIANDRNNVQILLKNAECLKKIQAYANCLSNLAAALYADKGQYKEQILLKRIQIFLQPKSFNLKEAKKDLAKLMNINKSSVQVCYLKGLILSVEGFRKESVLAYEQCLKQGNSKQTMCKSLVQIVKNKIDDRDFYSASYHINRSKYLDLSSPEIEIFKLFSEGVVHLMKRKVKQGNKNFTILQQKYPLLTPYLKKIFYLYKAFAKFSLSEYQQAIQSYELANKETPLDIFAKYNKQLAQGIVEMGKKNYEKGFEYLHTAQKTISLANLNKIDPYLYRGAAHIQKAKDLINSNNDLEQLKSLEEIFSGLKQFDKAYDINDSNSNMLYFRGLVYLYLGKYQQALQDIIKAISKSEQNVAKYFFFRALTHSSLGNKKQAINDYNICNNLDDKFEAVYLQRAKLHFSNENVTKGLEDLIKLKNLNSKQDIKYHEACLNYFYGHYAMANSCCNQITDQFNARSIKILIKTKLGKIKQAKKLAKSKADLMIFQIIQGNTQIAEVPSKDTQFFTIYHYYHYLGVKSFRLADYTKALDLFIMASKQRNLYDLEQGISNNNLSQEQQEQQQQSNDTDRDKDSLNRINYNIFLSYLMLQDWKKAYQVFIRDVVGVKESFLKNQFIASFSHLLFQALKQNRSLNKEQKQIYELNLYDSKLDRVLPEIIISLPNFIMKTRLCLLGLTNPKLEQSYITKANPDFVLEYMKISQIQNRPEPPWVKREQSGLIFTDEVQNINIQFQTTENDEDEEQGEGEDEQGEQQGQEQYEEQEQQQGQEEKKTGKISVRKFKQKMKLDDSIQRKLQKIMQKKNKEV